MDYGSAIIGDDRSITDYIPYGRQDINQQDIDAVIEVLRSDWITQGPAIERFEKAFSPQLCAENCGDSSMRKNHEEMITISDSFATVDLGSYYAILPIQSRYTTEQYCDIMGASPVPLGFSYNSGSNKQFLTVEELRELIKIHVDPKFRV